MVLLKNPSYWKNCLLVDRAQKSAHVDRIHSIPLVNIDGEERIYLIVDSHKVKSYLPTYLHTYLPTYLPSYLPGSVEAHYRPV